MCIVNLGLALPQALYKKYTFSVVKKGSQHKQRNKFVKVLIPGLAAREFVLQEFLGRNLFFKS